jgi:hypothetical protein
MARAIENTGRHHAALLDIPSFVTFAEQGQKLCRAADLIVIHRYYVGPVLQAGQYWRAQGKKVALDLDEAVDLITEDMPHYSLWQEGAFPANFFLPGDSEVKIEPAPLQQTIWSASHLDGITVSSQRLAGDWEKYGRVWEIPDFIYFDQYPVKTFNQRGKIWVGLRGDNLSRHTLLESGLLPALEQVCRARPQVCLFVGSAREDLLKSMNIAGRQKVFAPSHATSEWLQILSQLDIGLAPAVSEYDLRISRSRVLEYLAISIPWIASNRLPYRDLRPFGTLIDNSPDAWQESLLTVIDSLEIYRLKAQARPYLYAVSQDINENIGKVLDAYEEIIAQG